MDTTIAPKVPCNDCRVNGINAPAEWVISYYANCGTMRTRRCGFHAKPMLDLVGTRRGNHIYGVARIDTDGRTVGC